MEKATLRIGYGKARHNDRTDFESNKNIKDATKTELNTCYAINEKGQLFRCPLHQNELYKQQLQFYERTYGQSLQRKNAHYKKKGNYKQIHTMEEYYHSHPPKEIIFQIGKGDSHSIEELQQAIVKIIPVMTAMGCDILSVSFHQDETAIHCHLEYVMSYETNKGDIEVNYNAKLQQMGFKADREFDKETYLKEHPQATQKEVTIAKQQFERYHNAQINFTDILREKWYDKLNEIGIPIDRETDPKNRSRRNMTTQEYKLNKTVKELDRTIQTIKRKEDELAYLETSKKIADADRMIDYIKSKGLYDDYMKTQGNIKGDDGIWTEEEARNER